MFFVAGVRQGSQAAGDRRKALTYLCTTLTHYLSLNKKFTLLRTAFTHLTFVPVLMSTIPHVHRTPCDKCILTLPFFLGGGGGGFES